MTNFVLKSFPKVPGTFGKLFVKLVPGSSRSIYL